MAWFILFLAGLCEIVWAVGLKYSDGYTRLWPTVFTVVMMIVSFVLLGQAVKSLPLGNSYAIWTGIGAAGTAIYGMLIFGEPVTAVRLLCLAAIIGGVIGLKASAGG